MIIDSPILLGLGVGTDRRIPEDGDARVNLPSTILPILPTMLTTRDVPSSSVAILESACRDNGYRTNNNQAASNDLLITLPAGLYTLELSITAIGAIAQPLTVADTGVRITIEFGVSVVTLLCVFIGALVPQSVTGSFTVLMPTQFSLNHRVAITAVAQTILSRTSVNARRLL